MLDSVSATTCCPLTAVAKLIGSFVLNVGKDPLIAEKAEFTTEPPISLGLPDNTGDTLIASTAWAMPPIPPIVVSADCTDTVAAPISLITDCSNVFLLTVVLTAEIVFAIPEFAPENTTPAI